MMPFAVVLSTMVFSHPRPSPEDVTFYDRHEAHVLLHAPIPGALPPEDVLRQRVRDRPQIMQAMVEFLKEEEIMDPREVQTYLKKDTDFPQDLTLMRKRLVDLKDAPRLWEAERLPKREWVNDQIAFNRKYHKWLDEYILFNTDRAWIGRYVQKENQALYQVWDYVRDARCEFYYIPVRRVALKNLKCLLETNDFLIETCKEFGYEISYQQMKLPPIVPLWRFNEYK